MLMLHQYLIKRLIMARFDKFNAERSGGPSTPSDEPPSQNTQQGDSTGNRLNVVANMRRSSTAIDSAIDGEKLDVDEPDGAEERSKPPHKKRKAGMVDDDARLAAALQAEENNRVRATRGGTNKKATYGKGRPSSSKKKSQAKIEESGTESESSGKKKRNVNRSGGFHVSIPLQMVFIAVG